jgi:hypothetical protein
MTYRELTLEEAQAVVSWAYWAGHHHRQGWKQALSTAWMNASAGPVLQRLRNELGPSWLVKYSLSRAKKIVAAAKSAERST